MRRSAPLLALSAALMIVSIALLTRWPGFLHREASRVIAPPMHGEPRTMLWAWETPVDLRNLRPDRAGVAFLARQVSLGQYAVVHPRMQPLQVAAGTWLMAVVRIEPSSSFQPSSALVAETAAAVLGALAKSGIQGLQIDFDATASQRDFYAKVLRLVRGALPQGVPLSVTALVSWCETDSWLTALPSGALPIDEAVPMFFRMGGSAETRAQRARSRAVIAAPVCAGSAGVSTDEAWPALDGSQRVYLFRPGPWSQEEIATLNHFGYVGLHSRRP